jgi:ribonuclease Z
MRPTFLPRLVNDPFDDPGLFIHLRHENRALLFDMGDLSPLSHRDLLKIDHVFVSHTHMDHFFGFDRLLRIGMGRRKTVFLFGPEGFLKCLGSKLSAYRWNLVQEYDPLVFVGYEVDENRMRIRRFSSRDRFAPSGASEVRLQNDVLVDREGFRVRAVLLDHGIPCLAFRLEERYHVNILAEKVLQLGLAVGPWLNEFKKALYAGQDPDTPFPVPLSTAGATSERTMALGELRERIARVTPGQHVVYVADAAPTASNVERIVSFAERADRLFIEAAFLEEHREIAAEKGHLTAALAGRIAGQAGVRKWDVYHHSPRYREQAGRIREEAAVSFEKSLVDPMEKNG